MKRMPAPARHRNNANVSKFQAMAVASVITMYQPSVTRKSRLRPNRPVRLPKSSAPAAAPARYAVAASPTWIAPTTVTSRPSRTQVMPSPTATLKCRRLHGKRSSRYGISVVIA